MEEEKEDIWQTEQLKSIVSHFKEYIETKIKLWKLTTAEAIARFLSIIVLGILLLFMLVFVIGLLSVSLSLFIGSLIGSNALGFLIVALLHLMLTWLLIAKRKSLFLNPILGIIVNILFPENHEN